MRCGSGWTRMRWDELGITVPDVINAIDAQNTVNPAGQLGAEPSPPGQEFTYSVLAQGRLITPEQFGNIVLRENPNGGMVRIKDVGRVELGVQYYSLMGRLNGKPSAVIAIYQLPGSNAVDTANGVKKLMNQLQEPLSQRHRPMSSLWIKRAAVTEGIKEILITLLLALVLVILVVYLFLQDWRATLIPLLAGARFAGRNFCGLSSVRVLD